MVYSEHTIQQFWQRVARCPTGTVVRNVVGNGKAVKRAVAMDA